MPSLKLAVFGAISALGLAACAPTLSAPGESVRVAGTVTAIGQGPVQVQVFERCSPRFYFFEKCPGKFLGEAKIPKPGSFLTEMDTKAAELWIFAFRGVPGSEVECGDAVVPTSEARKGATIAIKEGACPVELPTKQFIP